MTQQEIAAVSSDRANQFAQRSQKAFRRNFAQNLSPQFFRINARSRLLDACLAVAGIADPGLTRRFALDAVSARGYRLHGRRARRSRPITIAKLAESFDYFIERCLSEALDCLDDRHFEMQLLVWRPFHAALGGGELIDQFEQPIGGD